MIHNDVIRSIRHMLNVSESTLLEIVKLGGGDATLSQMNSYTQKEDERGFVECDSKTMSCFLNGLIYYKRGKDDSRPPLGPEIPSNNVVLKKLRVAFELKDDDIVAIFARAHVTVSKTEVSAFFRKEGHPNYRPCGDQFLRNFLKGLTQRLGG